MKWIKKGLIFCPDGNSSWMKTHAALPVPVNIGGDLYRIYFASRDEENRSRIGYVEVDMREPQRILHLAENPVLDAGPLGSFDHYGVLPSCTVDWRGTIYLYYNGWDRGAEVNRFFIGLAISEDKGLTFRKISNVPVLDRSKEDPYFCASPYVMVENKHWRMWYSSAIAWEKINGRPMPRYYMKYAESNDGITWQRTGDACVDFKSKEEWAIAHPSVTKEGELYKMFYSYSVSDHGYRIGYAESPDGLRWTRMDEEAGIDVSASGWDSEMICYPFVFVRNGVKFMLYNGKRFGKTGFGYAMEQKSNE